MDAGFWSGLFDGGDPEPGASAEQVQELLALLSKPLDEEELRWAESVCARNPYPVFSPRHASYVAPDPRTWKAPTRGLPASYLSFLRWSNGGKFYQGNHIIEFVPFHGREANLRNMWLVSLFPLHAPSIVPFAGSPSHGDYYAFDTSIGAAGEFPVVYVNHESIWDQMVLAPTFIDFCLGRDNPERRYWSW